MAKYRKTIEVWPLSSAERKALQPGQWITAGGSLGRWAGQTPRGIDVAQWRGSAGCGLARFRMLRDYAQDKR